MTTTHINLDPNDLKVIASTIRGALQDVRDTYDAVGTAKEGVKTAQEGEVNARQVTLVHLAGLALAGGWSGDQIDRACALAISEGFANVETPKAIATFIGESKHAMNPNVRGIVGQLITLRDNAWEHEELLSVGDKAAPRPIKAAFSRKYHLMIELFKQAREGVVMTTVEDVIAHCEARNPALDPKKVFKEIEAIVGKLTTIRGNFALDELRAAIENLQDITPKALGASRVREVVPVVLTPATPFAAGHHTASVAPTVVAPTVAAPAPVDTSIDDLI